MHDLNYFFLQHYQKHTKNVGTRVTYYFLLKAGQIYYIYVIINLACLLLNFVYLRAVEFQRILSGQPAIGTVLF